MDKCIKVGGRRAFAIVCGLLLLLSAAPSSRAYAQVTEPVIRVGLGPDDDSKSIVYAAQAGMFKQAGLNVEIQLLAGGSVIAAAIAGGSLDIGKGAPPSVISAYAKGLPLTVIGGNAFYNTGSPPKLVVQTKSPIRDAKDIIGKTLGAVGLQDLSTLATIAWLTRNGVDWKSVQFVEMPAATALAAIRANRVVAMPLYEPMLANDLATGEVRVLADPFNAIGSHFAVGLLFADVSWVNAHLDLVKRFLGVMRQADDYVGHHEAETAPLFARFIGGDPSAIPPKIEHPERGVAIHPGDLQPVIDTLATYHVIPKQFSATEILCTCAPAR